MCFSKNLIQLRSKAGFSQEQLAAQLNVPVETIVGWETGNSLPDADKIIILSALFDVTTDQLLKNLDGEKNQKPKNDVFPIAGYIFLILIAVGGYISTFIIDPIRLMVDTASGIRWDYVSGPGIIAVLMMVVPVAIFTVIAICRLVGRFKSKK